MRTSAVPLLMTEEELEEWRDPETFLSAKRESSKRDLASLELLIEETLLSNPEVAAGVAK